MTAGPPLVVEVTRGSQVESRHLVHAVVVGPGLEELAAFGDPDRFTHPRSAVKMLQALPVVESGAADRFGLTDVDLAACCASHDGETRHLEAVRGLLARIGVPEAALECGPQEAGDGSPVTNNCSGKHAGFLAVCDHLGWRRQGYVHAGHPLQELVTETLAETLDVALRSGTDAIDGCGIPAHRAPLRSLAEAMVRFVDPDRWFAGDRVAAAHRLRRAMTAQAWMVGGTGRLDTDLMDAAGGDVVAKVGAEGVQAVGVVSARIGIAAKAEDGARRAVEVALGHLLGMAGLDGWDEVFASRREVRNKVGAVVGELRIAP